MANRSDAFSAKLPRYLKKIMAMGETYGYIQNSHERGHYKRAMIQAHANHIGYKLKRNSQDNRDAGEVE